MSKFTPSVSVARSGTPEPMPDTNIPQQPGHLRFLPPLLVIATLGLWLFPTTMSLWLDETATFWVIKDGLHSTIERALRFEGQSPLYYLIEWFARKIGGTSAFVLRAPSLIAAGVATFLLYRLGCRLFDRERALIAALLFAVTAPFVATASDARPYALGVMFLIAATLALVRWVDDGRAINGIVYVLLASLTVYTHYLLALPLAAHPVYVIIARRRVGRVSPKKFLVAIGGIAICLSPTLTQVSSLFSRRASLAYSVPLSFEAFSGVLAPSGLVLGLLIGWLVIRFSVKATFTPRVILPQTASLIGLWFVLPPLCLYLFSILSNTPVFQVRYYVTVLPAMALIVGWLIGAVEPRRARLFLVVAAMISSALTLPAAMYYKNEDWRGVSAAVNRLALSNTPVLIRTGFIESRQANWLVDPERVSYLLSPISYYKIRGKVVLLPLDLARSTEAYMDRVANGLMKTNFFVLVTRAQNPWQLWLEGRLRPLGFRDSFVGHFGRIDVITFVRSVRAGKQ